MTYCRGCRVALSTWHVHHHHTLPDTRILSCLMAAGRPLVVWSADLGDSLSALRSHDLLETHEDINNAPPPPVHPHTPAPPDSPSCPPLLFLLFLIHYSLLHSCLNSEQTVGTNLKLRDWQVSLGSKTKTGTWSIRALKVLLVTLWQ